MVTWLAMSPLSSETRTLLHCQSPGTEGGEGVETEGQTGLVGWIMLQRPRVGQYSKGKGQRDEGSDTEAQMLHSLKLLDITPCTCGYGVLP